MSQIRVVYHGHEPSFPATDQHPDAARYRVGRHAVDAIGGEPTEDEVAAFLAALGIGPAALEPAAVPPAPELTLDQVKSDLRRRINQEAERRRLLLLTPGDGMAAIYREKFEQAQAVHAMGKAEANALSPEDAAAQFPTLAASVGIEADSLSAVADLVLDRYATFVRVGSAIESVRLKAVRDIGLAPDRSAAEAVVASATWP